MKKTWIDRLYDARFSAKETTEWERLYFEEGLTQDEATDTMLERREKKFSKNT